MNAEQELQQLKSKLHTELNTLKSDERLTYPSASVFANAPLALIQCQMEAKIHLIEKVLGLEFTKFPIGKQ